MRNNLQFTAFDCITLITLGIKVQVCTCCFTIIRYETDKKAVSNICFLTNERDSKIILTSFHFLKEPPNFILCIIHVWSLFCSGRVNMSLLFLLIPLIKLGFRLSLFWFFAILYPWLLVFSFLCFKL